MTDTDSDISDSEGTWVDDVRNVDWFFLKSDKSKGKSKGRVQKKKKKLMD